MEMNPHDRFARRAFADLDVMRAHLRAFLPHALAARLDLPRLRREPDVHLDPDLRERLSDLVFSVPIVGGGTALVWFLFEHKSTPDRWLPFDLARSGVRLHEGWRRDHPEANHLPLLIPVVLYAGERPFAAPRRLLELSGGHAAVDDEVARCTLDIGYVLTDLSRVGDDVIRARVGHAAFAALAHLLLKHGREHDLVERLARWSDLLRDVLRAPTGLDALRSLLSYLCAVRGADAEHEVATIVVPRLDARDRESVMTTFKSYEDIVREQGEARGMQIGRQREAADKLLRVLRRRFEVPADVAARVDAAALEDLDRWFDRALGADSIDEVFAG